MERNHRRFTLIELMIVLVIFVILGGIIGQFFGLFPGHPYVPRTECVNGVMYSVDPEDGDLELIRHGGWGRGEKVTCDEYLENPNGNYVYDD